MATKIGPKTVTQRDRSKALVFCIDAAHGDSYGGQPFTQICGDPQFESSACANYTLGDASWTRVDFGHGLVGGRWYQEDTSDVMVRSLLASSNPSSGQTVTWSFYVWTNASKSSYVKSQITIFVDGVRNWLQDNNTWSTVVNEYNQVIKPTQVGKWHRIYWTITFPSGTLTSISWGGFYRTSDYFTMKIANAQLEGGSTPSVWSKTSRTAANAVKNISGVGAQGTTLTGTFATYGQQLHKLFPTAGDPSLGRPDIGGHIYQPRVRNVNTTVDPNKGHIGGAYWDFDGSDEYIDLGASSRFGITNAVSICAWVKLNTLSGWGGVFGTYYGGNFMHFQMYLGGLNVYVYGPAAGYDRNDTECFVTAGEWAYVGFTFGDSTLTIYRDGEPMPTTVAGSSASVNSTSDVSIGRVYSSSRMLDGALASLMIWSAALTAKEIKDIYIAQKGRFGK